MRTLDLFCGCGGLSHGVSLAEGGSEIEVVAGLDFSPASLETFAKNHSGATPVEADIRKADVNSLAKSLGRPEMIIGGPSCQGFSTHGKRLADDPRNFLYKNFMSFVEEMKPTWVLMENVTGLLRYGGGVFRDNIIEDFQRMGYVVSLAQLQAADYGVPQTRKRVFFVANRLRIPFFFPRPSHFNAEARSDELFRSSGSLEVPQMPYATIEDAIGDLPWIGLGADASSAPTTYASEALCELQRFFRGDKQKPLTLHYGSPVPEENYERIKCIPRGGDWLDIPAELLPSRLKRVLSKDATTLYYRLRWNRPGYTITTVYRNVSSGAFTHPDEDRALTHREAARIQSFPDHFEFVPSNIGKQIGNAVPPLLAKAIGEAIVRHDRVYRKVGLRSLSKFKSEVMREELEARELALRNSSTRELLRGTEIIRPVPQSALRRVRKILDSAECEQHSQMPLELVLPVVYDRIVNKRLHAPIAGLSDSSITRLVDFWQRRGVLSHIKAALAKDAGDGVAEPSATYSSVRPRRKRPSRVNSHHMATVLYEVSPETRCTTATPTFVSTHD